ncbi:MAG: peptide chain release factor 2, partial [Deltaproteobacteria bacterium]|nr:peptide chain release factor 2 [Deltaproteobacteria bacterium]
MQVEAKTLSKLKQIEQQFLENKKEKEHAEKERLKNEESRNARLKEIKKLQEEPSFWEDTQKAKVLNQELERIKKEVEEFKSLSQEQEDIGVLFDLAEEMGDQETEEEALSRLKHLSQALANLEFKLLLGEPEDKLGAILTIHAGAGGTESCDWAQMLSRMYMRYAECQGFGIQMIETTPGDEAGIKSITLSIEGPYAYGYLKAENGVHRLVRISPFDANQRRHTSFASVFASPQIDDSIVVEVESKDLRIDTYRAGGKGGQNVQKNDTAVRITHLPTNTVVQCQSERSQLRNKELAMKVLKSRLYELELEKKRAIQAEQESNKKRIEWGSQIRSYVLHPYKMVKDHRSNFEVGNAEAVLDGDLDALIQSYLGL